jgi:hypothetical protein
MCETFGIMQDLMAYSRDNQNLSLTQSMQAYIHSSQRQMAQMQQAQNNPAMMQQMQQQQQGANGVANRQMLGQHMTMSPAMQAGLIPNNIQNGSPHLSSGHNPMQSPALSNMAPPMAAQRSQQGNATAGASAGTSPNMSTKRRRSTQPNVKNEEDGVNMNGTSKKVKPSPSMANAKRGKQG